MLALIADSRVVRRVRIWVRDSWRLWRLVIWISCRFWASGDVSEEAVGVSCLDSGCVGMRERLESCVRSSARERW
jgi:hypothetical protein